jgi:tetratricopeptide (TPR) repeat protein
MKFWVTLLTLLVLVLISPRICGADESPWWASELAAARRAFTAGEYALAAEQYAAALKKAEEQQAAAPALLSILRLRAAALRIAGSAVSAEEALLRCAGLVTSLHGPSSLELASVLSDIAVVQRAQDHRDQADSSLAKAIDIRSAIGISEELARDLTLRGAIKHEMGEDDLAVSFYLQAIAFWGALPESGLHILTALDPLAAIYRDQSNYPLAEEHYLRALRLREAALGSKDPELIVTIDSLAYTLFGQKKYADAEPYYLRLLSLWETSAGPEHPMVALTLDKMVEFYNDQKLYEKSEPLAQRSLTLRTKSLIESFHRTGRIMVGQKRFEEALILYERVVRIADDAKVTAEQMDGVLRTYALLLRQLKREEEAAAIDLRVSEALTRKADRDGTRRPRPKPVAP